MGKSWKKSGMIANSQKKGAQFTKLAREIQVATRLGGGNPESNSRLKLAIQNAQKMSCPKATVERAIQKGSGQLKDTEQIEEVLYEGQGPYSIGLLILCQTDNRHRTVSEVKNILKKHDSQMGEPGSMMWMFDKMSLIEASKKNVTDPEEDAIEVGANFVEKEDNHYYFYGNLSDLENIRTALIKRDWQIESAEPYYLAKNFVSLDKEQEVQIVELLEVLEENQDTHRIYTNLKLK